MTMGPRFLWLGIEEHVSDFEAHRIDHLLSPLAEADRVQQACCDRN